MKSINPLNEKQLSTYDPLPQEDLEAAILAADAAFATWRNSDFDQREALLRAVADTLRENSTEYATLITQEMGKPIAQAEAEVEKCARVAEYYAEHGKALLSKQIVQTEAQKSYVSFEPLGVILAIMPWNFPFWQVFRFALPSIMAGNTVLLKHASNVSGCSLAIEAILRQAKCPPHVFTSLLATSDQVPKIIKHTSVKAITLTGSTQAGQAVAQQAGTQVKPCVLELGGSDPYLILDDADLKLAAEQCVSSRLINSGQSCIAAKRFIVVENQVAPFTERVKQQLDQHIMGDPMDPNTTIGPLARIDLRDELHAQVERSIQQGATCLTGGFTPKTKGAFYPPTLLINVKPGMPAFDEELFGPVAAIITARDTEHAIELANHSPFGLGAAIFSQDQPAAEAIARHKLRAGSVFINEFVKSDPRLPFGGIKFSGYGRELGEYGIKAFVNIKTVVVN